eukprot:Skav202378  [mRNA]  locus=scaffold1406:226269:228786:- [translate_table: standard]
MRPRFGVGSSDAVPRCTAVWPWWRDACGPAVLFQGLGCVLLTLYTGERPFPVQSSREHLAVMQRVVGELPKEMVKLAATGGTLPEDASVDSRGCLQLNRKLPDEAQELLNMARPLQQRILPQHGAFLKLLEALLSMQPDRRISAEDALKQPFLTSEPVE